MSSSKMTTLLICVGCLTLALDNLNSYGLSYMQIPAMLSIVVLFICIIYFYDRLFSYIWGCITAIIIFIPAFLTIFEQTVNYKAVAMDMTLSLFLMIFFGFKTIKKMKTKKQNSV